MDRRDAYIALMTSLPSSERLFVAKQPPLSRLRLDRRLKVLSDEDAATLSRVEDLVRWNAYDMSTSDQDALDRAQKALEHIAQPRLRAMIIERMELRTLIAALRHRKRGEGPPAGVWGYGTLPKRIAANWTDPTFGLESRVPWLREAATLFARNDPKAFERHMLEVTFRQLQRHARQHLFDLEAVVIYVLKWTIFDRWAHANSEAAKRRFCALTETALADFPELTIQGTG